ncbi:hypothetical protein C8R46DRAFT_1117514 [Mycena filopes]|nr:hypothetical protein C8R46DRAFT_1117514 [Mycena filopes]
MAAVSQAPSGLDKDPEAYLALPRFHHTLDFELDLPGVGPHTETVSYALTDAPPDRSWPVLVFFNGLGGHRLIAALTEGIAREHHVQLLTLDKPAGGRSSPTPLAARTRWMHAALLAVLAHERIPRFAALSHSNGIFYALYTLLHLPPTLTATSWALTGPFVPASISGAAGLRIAATLPAALPGALGSLLQLVPPVARAMTWSGGFLGAVSMATATPVGPQEREERKPAHKRQYMHRYVNEACRSAIMSRGMREGRVAMGQEALLCLHGGAPAPGGEGESEPNSVWGIGGGATDADVLRGAFARLAERYPDDALRMSVVYGADDGLVPAQGRTWLKGVLTTAGLLRRENDAWKEVEGAGHDDVLFLEAVVGEIFGRVA